MDKIVLAFQIIAFELVAVNSSYYDEILVIGTRRVIKQT